MFSEVRTLNAQPPRTLQTAQTAQTAQTPHARSYSKIVLLDVDGVLLDLIPAAIEFVHAKYQHLITPGCITSWGWDYCLGFPESDTPALWDHIWSTPACPCPGALNFIASLRGLGYKPVGLSNRPRNWKGLTDPAAAFKAAERDFPQLGLDYWITVEHQNEKITKVLSNFPDARLMLEDNPNTARDVALFTRVPSYLIDAPWNLECITVIPTWTRVHRHSEIIQMLVEDVGTDVGTGVSHE